MPGPGAIPPASVIPAMARRARPASALSRSNPWTQARPPLRFLFEIHDDPIWSHPIWFEHDNTYPCARVDVRTQRTAEGKHSWVPAAGPAGTVEATLKALYRLIDGFGPVLGPRNRPFRWYMQPAGFGCVYEKKFQEQYPNAIPLLDHPEDRLVSGRRGPWARRGIELNRAWAHEFLDHLVQELRARRLPDPVAFILASENGVKDDYWGHEGNPDHGWVPEALNDNRSNDPLFTIDGTHTFKQYYQAARSLDGSPIPAYDDTAGPAMPPGRHPKNHESSEQYRGAFRRLWEYSRYTAFAEPAVNAFMRDASRPEDTVRVGEYQAACDSKTSPVNVSPTLKIHQMDGYFRCSLQCPDWYGGMPNWLDENVFSANHPGWPTQRNWQRALNITDQDPKRRVERGGLEMFKLQVSQHAHAAPGAALAPYVNDLSNIPVADMIELLHHCRELGGWGVNIFMPECTRDGLDRWKKVVDALAE